jgi:hypothetical protein
MVLAGLTSTNAGNNSSDTFLGPFQTSASTTPESAVQMVMPIGGKIENLAVNIASAPGGGKTWAFTIRKAGSDTEVSCSMSGGGGTSCIDNTHQAEFKAGELISLKVHPSGSPNSWTSARWSVTLTG